MNRIENWIKQFAIIYAGQAFSILGSAAVQFAIIWWLTIQTESAITLTIASVVAFLPNMLIGPFAGVWIDRYNRRSVMIAADGLVAVSSIILGAAFLLLQTPPIWFIYIVLFIRGLGNTFHGPAMQAAIPMFVPTDMLTKAGGLRSLINSCSSTVRLSFSRLEPVVLMRLTHLSKADAVRSYSRMISLLGFPWLNSSTNCFFCSSLNVLLARFSVMVFSFSFFFKRIPLPYLFCTV